MDIKVSETSEGISVYSIAEHYLSQVNTMYVPKDVYGVSGLYVNRVIVHEKIRHHGVGTSLMNKLVNIADGKGISLLLEINPYGDMGHEQLKSFYGKFGFKESELNGLYVRTPNGESLL